MIDIKKGMKDATTQQVQLMKQKNDKLQEEIMQEQNRTLSSIEERTNETIKRIYTEIGKIEDNVKGDFQKLLKKELTSSKNSSGLELQRWKDGDLKRGSRHYTNMWMNCMYNSKKM